MQNGPLKLQNVVANPAYRGEKLRISRRVRFSQLGLRNSDRLRRQLRLVQRPRILQHRRQAPAFHLAANPLHHLLRRQRLAKNLNRPPPPRLAHHISRRAQLLPQRSQLHRHVIPTSINSLDLQHGIGNR